MVTTCSVVMASQPHAACKPWALTPARSRTRLWGKSYLSCLLSMPTVRPGGDVECDDADAVEPKLPTQFKLSLPNATVSNYSQGHDIEVGLG
jgi:hypothetical protein